MATRKKPRLVILLSSGILENVMVDQKVNIEILKVDVDEESEYPVIYRLHPVEVNPKGVEEYFRNAKRFWEEQEEK